MERGMLTLPELLIICSALAALYAWEWWRHKP